MAGRRDPTRRAPTPEEIARDAAITPTDVARARARFRRAVRGRLRDLLDAAPFQPEPPAPAEPPPPARPEDEVL